MKKGLSDRQKNILLCLALVGVMTAFIKSDDYLRRDGIPKDKEMTLIKKEILKRKVDTSAKNYREEYLPAEEYTQLSFDMDGNINTVEATAIPESEQWSGIDETKQFRIGEHKTLKDWNNALEEAGVQRKMGLFSNKERESVAILWQWQRVHK